MIDQMRDTALMPFMPCELVIVWTLHATRLSADLKATRLHNVLEVGRIKHALANLHTAYSQIL
jgi:hypothetical protein